MKNLISSRKRAPQVWLVAQTSCALALPLFFLGGCGGGGGGSSPSPTGTPRPATPRPTATPRPDAVSLVVQLRDPQGAAVDGIVTVGSVRLATNGGQAIFRGIAAGTARVSAEVNGFTTSGTTSVASSGSTTFVLRIASNITPGPTSSPPDPPVFN
ncbi:MAG TPA: hypothetical protein VGB45_08180 [Abditibacterium sp.]